ncbi:MAG: NifB/NifX family molybdenum-iron cluster-binding protein [Candidatus Izimaplasma sp.]|nr:NifB/NifX family molybdenum-iron cluster-binding protein [Candidatus Izimaplasma bacterium]
MKIAICSTTNSFEALVSNRFARCNYFAIYDNKKLNYSFVENKAKNDTSGAAKKAVKILDNLNVSIVLVPKIGSKGINNLRALNISIYQYDTLMTIKEVLYEFFEKNLKQISQPNAKGITSCHA